MSPAPNGGTHRRARRWTVALAAVAVVAAGLTAAGFYAAREQVYNFGMVREGVLYRSGQPNANGWRRLARVHGVRTVIDLRENNHEPPPDWAVEQEQACRELGMRLVHVPMESRDAPTAEQWRTFLQTVEDPANWPVLVHCEMGTSRTGMMVGAYRIAVQGWSVAATTEDAEKHYFAPHKHPEYCAFWEELAKSRRP